MIPLNQGTSSPVPPQPNFQEDADTDGCEEMNTGVRDITAGRGTASGRGRAVAREMMSSQEKKDNDRVLSNALPEDLQVMSGFVFVSFIYL